jgi:hypothetical protein
VERRKCDWDRCWLYRASCTLRHPRMALGERAFLQRRLIRKRIILVACVFVIFLSGTFFTLVYYLSIYFQSVSGVSPSASGTRNLGIILSISVCTILSGGMITVFGQFVPWMIVGSAIATLGAGLILTLKIGSPSSHWMGYQVLAGIGLGPSPHNHCTSKRGYYLGHIIRIRPCSLSVSSSLLLSSVLLLTEFFPSFKPSGAAFLSLQPKPDLRTVFCRASKPMHRT